jgi:LacI family transcriptional regulator
MTRAARPNLRQIATSLGLSVTTVSRALKDGPEVHPTTINRVKKAAAEAGYTPNFHGQALRTGRTYTITLLLPLETRGYLSDLAKVPLIEGMTLAAQESGYTLTVYSTSPEEDPLRSLDRLIQSGSSDGVVITRMLARDPRIDFIRRRSVPFVTFGRSSGDDADYSCVDIDNENMGRTAVAHLVKAGRRRIAIQLLSRDDQSSAMRLDGYRAGLAAGGLALDESLIGYGHFTMADSESFFDGLLETPHPPTGLICANELGLLGAISALRKRNLVAGRDVSLVARDSTEMCRYLAIPVLAHFVDMSEVGRLIVAALLRQIGEPVGKPTRVIVPGEFKNYG